MEFEAWVERVRTFSMALQMQPLPGTFNMDVEIDPPCTQEELREFSKKWPAGVPSALQKLWFEGAARIQCNYWWEPPANELDRLKEVFEYVTFIYGGVRFKSAETIYPGNFGITADDRKDYEFWSDREFELWRRCAIFQDIGNGDSLALDPETNPDDPAVVYLIHDEDGSAQICPSFSKFIATWEELCYIGPEHWLLGHWIDWDQGVMDTIRHKAAELRELLTPRPM